MKRLSPGAFNWLAVIFMLACVLLVTTCSHEATAQQLEIKLSWDHDPSQGVPTEEYWVYAAIPADPLDQATPVVVQPTTGATKHSINLPYPSVPMQYGVKAVSVSTGTESPMSVPVSLKPGIPAPTNLTISNP